MKTFLDVVKYGFVLLILLSNCFLMIYLVYGGMTDAKHTFNCLTEVTMTLLAVANTIIYIKKNLFTVNDLFNMKNIKNVGIFIVIALGLCIPLYYVSAVVPLIIEYGYEPQNQTLINETVYYIGELCYDIFYPVFSVLILITNVIFMRKFRDFSYKIKTVQEYLMELMMNDNVDCFSTTTLKDVEGEINQLCVTSASLENDFTLAVFISVSVVPVRIMNICEFFITEAAELKSTGIIELVLDSLYAFMSFIMICEVSDEVEVEKKKTQIMLTKMTIKASFFEDQGPSQTMREIRTMLHESVFSVTGFGFFYINRPFFLTLTGVLITYCVLIYQFAAGTT